ncbi:MAG: AraC family transcriptional regulator [Kiritimatiellae bacterium]|nr:AraC family transcriptional regulator [Kiritimatiellia bacterium]
MKTKVKNRSLPERKVTDDNCIVSLEDDSIPCITHLQYHHPHRTYSPAALHRHQGCIELFYCQRGSIVFHCAGKELTVLPGELIIIPQEIDHHLADNKSGIAYYDLVLRLDTPKPILKLPRKEAALLKRSVSEIGLRVFRVSKETPRLFRSLFEIRRTTGPSLYRTLLLRAAALQLLLQIVRDSRAGIPSGDSSAKRIETIIREIRGAPGETGDLMEMAQRCGMCYAIFSNTFRKITGLPPHAFILAERLAKARGLLTGTGLSITRIAHDLGFYSSQHFSARFKRVYNVTPVKFRNANRAGRSSNVRSF